MSEFLNEKTKNILESTWVPPSIPDLNSIASGDMPGDRVKICEEHVSKTQNIFPELLNMLIPILNKNSNKKAVISVYGGSGVGKTCISSLISHYLKALNIGTYILSGDNYPHRIPKYNDAERFRVFREAGIKGLVLSGEYTNERNIILQQLQDTDDDTNPENAKEYKWLSVYQEAGGEALKNYLGTTNEIDFAEITGIIEKFKKGASSILLKRVGREEKDLWYDPIDFSNVNVLIIEWTHGNNKDLLGLDIPIFLNSTPQETLLHRKLRNRDGGADSPFTTMVLAIEQELLFSQTISAKIILTKSGDIISYDQLLKIWHGEGKNEN